MNDHSEINQKEVHNVIGGPLDLHTLYTKFGISKQLVKIIDLEKKHFVYLKRMSFKLSLLKIKGGVYIDPSFCKF